MLVSFCYYNHQHEEEEATKSWQSKAATALLNNGNKRLLVALSNSMAKGIPSLVRASLLTVACMSCYLHSFRDKGFQSMACSILVPQLLESSNNNRALDERALAYFSLQRLIKSSGMAKLALLIV